MLVGEPGIGKTSLADAVAAEAEPIGFRVAWGRAWESGGAPPYFPWIQALHMLGVGVPDASLATAVEAEAARFQVFRRIVDELRSAASGSPVLLVFDDLHVADVASLRALQFVARELRSLKVAIVGTRRDVDVRMTAEIESTLARIAREGQTYALGRLARDDVARLVRAGSDSIAGEFEASIWQTSQGNPLFVAEIVRLIASDPAAVRGQPLPIPFGVREVIRQRLALLDDLALELLDIAAVIGGEADELVLRAVSGKPPAIVADSLAAAMRARVVTVSSGRVRFAHALIRETLYQDVPRTRRVAIHAAVADTLEGEGSSRLVEIAHHGIEAGRSIVPRVSRAARSLLTAYADEDAVELVERALRVLDSALDERGGSELRVLLGAMQMRTGNVSGGRAVCLRAATAARALGDADLFARAALAYGTELTSGETDPMTRTLLEESLERLGEEHVVLRSRVEARLAASLQPAPDPRAIARIALGATATARRLGDDEALLDVLHNAGAAVHEAVYAPEALDMARDAVRLAANLGDRAKLFRARLRLIHSLMEEGDVAGADANIDAFESEARATGQARHLWPVLFLRSMRAMQEGRFDDSDALVEEAEASAACSPDPTARYAVLMHRFARMRQKELAGIVAIEPELLKVVGRWNDPQSFTDLMIAVVRAVAGEIEIARRHLARVRLDSTAGNIRIALGTLADVAVRVGETARAAELYERLRPDEGHWLTGGFSAVGTYARYLGTFAAMLGRHAEAERHFEAALALADAASARPERGRILAAHGAMLLGRGAPGDEAKARTFFGEARAIGQELGLARLLASLPASNAAPSEAPPRREKTGLRHAPSLTLSPEGDTWLLSLGAASVRLKDGLGVRYIARLVAEPEHEIHALDLAGASDEGGSGDSGEMLDAEARAAYKRRLAELDEELREAESWNDGARTARARAEIELLSAELARAVGIGGRERRSGSAAERARVAVTRRIRELIRRVTDQSPEVGRYLDCTVKTGTYCSYRPM